MRQEQRTLDGGGSLSNGAKVEAFFLARVKLIHKLAILIRIPGLPMELYNHRFLLRVVLRLEQC